MPAFTGPAGADDAVRDAKPDLEPVTAMVMVWPTSAFVSVYAVFVAPVMMTPSRSHWYFSVTSLGDHVPAFALSVDPTVGAPVTLGSGPLIVFLPLKWMNWVG